MLILRSVRFGLLAVVLSGIVSACTTNESSTSTLNVTNNGPSGPGGTPPLDSTVTSVTLSPETITLMHGTVLSCTLHSATLSAVAQLKSGVTINDPTRFVWVSLNPNVATVSSAGVVTEVSVGTALITGKLPWSTLSDTTTVIVSSPASCTTPPVDSSITSVDVTPKTATIFVGGSQQYAVTFVPVFANTTGGTWTSSNMNIATVDQNGRATGISVGTVSICYTSRNGKQSCGSLTVTAVVVTPPVFQIAASDSVLSEASCAGTHTAGMTSTIVGTTYTSDNTSVVTVNSTTGLVTSVGAGTAHIIATAPGGATLQKLFTVVSCISNVTTITLIPPNGTGVQGNFGHDSAAVTNPPAGYTGIFWTSSNPSRVDVIQSDVTFTAKTGTWAAGFHKAGEIAYLNLGSSVICAFVTVNNKPTNVSACGTWTTTVAASGEIFYTDARMFDLVREADHSVRLDSRKGIEVKVLP